MVVLNGIFGVVAQARPELEWAEWASECCTTWGSFGYLLSALCQWYASIGPTGEGEVVSLEKIKIWKTC
jgi:hypothetical protein